MPTFHAISKTTHGQQRWQRYSSYAFARQDALAPLVAQELPRAALHLPIAFVAQGGQFMPVAVLGIAPGQNLCVASDGRWLGGYTPAAYRSHPFALAQLADGQQALAFDADSGLLTQDSSGEPFFDEAGQPAPAVQEILGFLTQVQANRALTQRICQALAAEQLLQPWPITVQTDSGAHQVEGLSRIDEAALNALPADALKVLQQAGALPVVYSQLLSMQHLPVLGQLAQARARQQVQQEAPPPLPTTASGELDLEFLARDGTLRFA